MRTSPLYAQKASGKPDAIFVQERGKCTICSSRLKRMFEVSIIRRSESFEDTQSIVFI